MPLPDSVRRTVEHALSARFGGCVHITAVQNFWPSCVFRCTLQQSSLVAPKTVIVRVPRVGTARSGGARLDHEQAALEYLTGIGSRLAPRYLAGSSAAAFLVTEDLGAGPSLLDILLGVDPEAATRGCLAFARGLGQLHAQTAGRPVGLPVIHIPVAEHWRQVQDAVARLELPAPDGADGDIEAVARLLAKPGGCLALSSGDPSAVNCKVADDAVRFFDFEAAGFRHALVDAAVLRYLYPTGAPPWCVPQEVESAAESAYRAELAPLCPTVRDDAQYERGMAAACAAWTILRLVRLPRVNAGPDPDSWLLLPPAWSRPPPVRSRRRQLVAILETFIASSHRARAFEVLAAWCEHLTDALRGRWPEAVGETPLYPAFS